MAPNTKYHAAPQRDSFEESSYTQAPPSYQAAGPSDGLLGEPRGEDDNVPDDFKVSFSDLPSLSQTSPLTFSLSSADPFPKPRSTSACNSFGKSTPSLQSSSSLLLSSPPSHSFPNPTAHGSSPTAGLCGVRFSAPSASCSSLSGSASPTQQICSF